MELNKTNIVEWVTKANVAAYPHFGKGMYALSDELLETYDGMTPEEAVKEDIHRCQ